MYWNHVLGSVLGPSQDTHGGAGSGSCPGKGMVMGKALEHSSDQE